MERKKEGEEMEEEEEEEERAGAENVSEKQALWHGDLQGITSCNKVEYIFFQFYPGLFCLFFEFLVSMCKSKIFVSN